jgi:hypothetical protein
MPKKEAKEILKQVKIMCETNTRVNWDWAELTPAKEFQAILDFIKNAKKRSQ